MPSSAVQADLVTLAEFIFSKSMFQASFSHHLSALDALIPPEANVEDVASRR